MNETTIRPPTTQIDFADRAAVSLHRAGLFPESATIAELQSLMEKTAKLIRIEHETLVTDSPYPYWTISAMVAYGGGFVSHIGEAARHADADNLARIRKAWPEYWEKYENMGIKMQKAEAAKDQSP